MLMQSISRLRIPTNVGRRNPLEAKGQYDPLGKPRSAAQKCFGTGKIPFGQSLTLLSAKRKRILFFKAIKPFLQNPGDLLINRISPLKKKWKHLKDFKNRYGFTWGGRGLSRKVQSRFLTLSCKEMKLFRFNYRRLVYWEPSVLHARELRERIEDIRNVKSTFDFTRARVALWKPFDDFAKARQIVLNPWMHGDGEGENFIYYDPDDRLSVAYTDRLGDTKDYPWNSVYREPLPDDPYILWAITHYCEPCQRAGRLLVQKKGKMVPQCTPKFLTVDDDLSVRLAKLSKEPDPTGQNWEIIPKGFVLTGRGTLEKTEERAASDAKRMSYAERSRKGLITNYGFVFYHCCRKTHGSSLPPCENKGLLPLHLYSDGRRQTDVRTEDLESRPILTFRKYCDESIRYVNSDIALDLVQGISDPLTVLSTVFPPCGKSEYILPCSKCLGNWVDTPRCYFCNNEGRVAAYRQQGPGYIFVSKISPDLWDNTKLGITGRIHPGFTDSELENYSPNSGYPESRTQRSRSHLRVRGAGRPHIPAVAGPSRSTRRGNYRV